MRDCNRVGSLNNRTLDELINAIKINIQDDIR